MDYYRFCDYLIISSPLKTKLHMKKNLAEVVRLKLDDQELAVIHNPSRGS